MSKYWIAVASADHARRGRELGIMQVGHGKCGPLRRVSAGDGIVYYSPVVALEGKEKLQAFTTLGRVKAGDVYQADMGGGFKPFRRDVEYVAAKEAPILPLLDALELTRRKKNWGYAFRLGLVEISRSDFDAIASAMTATL